MPARTSEGQSPNSPFRLRSECPPLLGFSSRITKSPVRLTLREAGEDRDVDSSGTSSVALEVLTVEDIQGKDIQGPTSQKSRTHEQVSVLVCAVGRFVGCESRARTEWHGCRHCHR